MKRIKVILPVSTKLFNEIVEKELENFSLDTRISFDIESLPKGPASIECEYDVAVAAPYIIEVAEKAEKDGFDGVVIYCFDDPAVNACKERLNIPVIGAGQAGVLYGNLLGKSYSVLMTVENALMVTREMIETNKLSSGLASIRVTNIPVVELGQDDSLFDTLLKTAKEAIENDNAEVLVLGCTGMMGIAERLQSEISNMMGRYIPVVSPGAAALHLMQTMILLGYKQSKLSFMMPPEKERRK
jgi:allantoin racemase